MPVVTCGNCETSFDEPLGLKPEERYLCPSCGSTTRLVFVQMSVPVEVLATVATSVTVSIEAIALKSDLLLQAVIVPGARTGEGRLIEAVAVPWFGIIELLKKNPELAHRIPSDKWEELIAGAYKQAGFEEVTLTPRSGDRGRDIIAIKKGVGSIRVIGQVKAYKPGHLVTANDVRALIGVLHGDGASKGFLTTTSDFAPLLRTDPLIVPFMPSRLELIVTIRRRPPWRKSVRRRG